MRPRYRGYPPSEIPFSPIISPSNPFRILDLPLELIDRITSSLPPRTRLNLAYTCHTAYDLLIPLIYRTIDITSPNRLLALFASPNISHLILIDQHTRAFNLSLVLDGGALRAIRQAAALCPGGKLFNDPTTLLLSQKARYSLIDYPQYAIILKYFSLSLSVHVKWSGPSRIPHHYTRLFENFGQIASACQASTFHLHFRMNEFLRMPPEAMTMFRLTKPENCASTIRIYVHPTLRRPGGKNPKEADLVSQLGAPIFDIRNAFLEARRADQEDWNAVERSIKLLCPLAYGKNGSTAGHDLANVSKSDPNRPRAKLEMIILNRSPEEIKELTAENKRRELLCPDTGYDVDQADESMGGAEAIFALEGKGGRSGCLICME